MTLSELWMTFWKVLGIQNNQKMYLKFEVVKPKKTSYVGPDQLESKGSKGLLY